MCVYVCVCGGGGGGVVKREDGFIESDLGYFM